MTGSKKHVGDVLCEVQGRHAVMREDVTQPVAVALV